MSRFALSEVFVFPSDNTLHDLNGWTLEDWDGEGAMGWDSNLSTYFMQLDNPSNDEPAWWFGRTAALLTSPFELQAILRALFDVVGQGLFAFKPEVLTHLINERDQDFQASGVAVDAPAQAAELLRSFRERDEQFELSDERDMVLDPLWLRHYADAGAKPGQNAVH